MINILVMIIKICVGSSCHLKGSYDVIEHLQTIVKKYDVEDLVELQASFCLGFCAEGVTVKAEGFDQPIIQKINKNELFLHNVNVNNIEELFAKEIYPIIQMQISKA
jgi:NADH:ubiquinone oxidoreductase 24 kD subunit